MTSRFRPYWTLHRDDPPTLWERLRDASIILSDLALLGSAVALVWLALVVFGGRP